MEKHSQYLETLTCRLKTTDHKIQLLNASKTPSLTLSQLSSHTIEIQIGSPLTLLQGFAFILTMI